MNNKLTHYFNMSPTIYRNNKYRFFSGYSDCSITNITNLGFWLFIDEKEYFLPFNEYPEFKNVPISSIFNMKRLGANQLSWEELDIDLEVESLVNPKKYSLIYGYKKQSIL